MASTALTAQTIVDNQSEVATKLTELLDATAGGLAYANLIDVRVVPYGANRFLIVIVYHV